MFFNKNENKGEKVSQQLLISGALANVGGKISTDDFLRFLAEQLPEAELFKITGVSAAAFDWRGIFRDVAAVASIGSVLWLGYTELIAPTKSDTKSDAGIYIVIGDPSDKNSQFWIGKDYKDKDIFLKNFKKRVKKVTEEEDAQGRIRREIIETEESTHWLEIE